MYFLKGVDFRVMFTKKDHFLVWATRVPDQSV